LLTGQSGDKAAHGHPICGLAKLWTGSFKDCLICKKHIVKEITFGAIICCQFFCHALPKTDYSANCPVWELSRSWVDRLRVG